MRYMYHVPRDPGRLQACAAFRHLVATFMREVAAVHLSVVVVQVIDARRAGVAGVKISSARSRLSYIACTGGVGEA